MTNAHFARGTGRCSAKSPHNRAGSVPQKSTSVTSDISGAERSAGFPACGSAIGRSAPAPFHPALRLRFTFPVRRTAGRSLVFCIFCGRIWSIALLIFCFATGNWFCQSKSNCNIRFSHLNTRHQIGPFFGTTFLIASQVLVDRLVKRFANADGICNEICAEDVGRDFELLSTGSDDEETFT